MLKARSEFLKSIRTFFDKRGVIEVDTPVLMRGVNTDPFIQAFQCQERFLQTSPEFAMKRLLSEHPIPMYYLGKAFRLEECGRFHNPEFTMLEWYRPGWDHHQLIAEVVDLFQTLLGAPSPEIKTYQELFAPLDIHPHTLDLDTLRRKTLLLQPEEKMLIDLDLSGLLEWLFMTEIESRFDPHQLMIVTEFPKAQAQLAQCVKDREGNWVGARFEVYYQGCELANGYFELTDAKEQRKRFELDNARRKAHGLPEMPIDQALLVALEKGLPEMSGVAVGVDRLLMIKMGAQHIQDVLPLYWAQS